MHGLGNMVCFNCMHGDSDMCVDCDKYSRFKSLFSYVVNSSKVINDEGGTQSRLDYRFDLIDTTAIFTLAKVLHEGVQEYGEDNWRKISVESHLNHAIAHIYAYLAKDYNDDHLEHAFTRLMMALGVRG